MSSSIEQAFTVSAYYQARAAEKLAKAVEDIIAYNDLHWDQPLEEREERERALARALIRYRSVTS